MGIQNNLLKDLAIVVCQNDSISNWISFFVETINAPVVLMMNLMMIMMSEDENYHE